MTKRPHYPFVPKSTTHLKAGHFWSIPLQNRGFACGRVIQLRIQNDKRDSRVFLGGLMDWFGESPPTAEAIAGCGVIAQGSLHVKAIRENAGQVLGFRDLSLEDIEPGLFRDAH